MTPDGGDLLGRSAFDDADPRSGRADRPGFIGFITDGESEAAVREGLTEALSTGMDVRRGGIRAAIATFRKTATPLVLLVDIGNEDQPLTALSELSEVVEPDVRVLVIGDRADVDFYRQLTRALGVAEYLYKPLTRDMVARHFGPTASRRSAPVEFVHGGRVVAVTGAGGGVGATTVAVNLAWHFAQEARRHTVVLDPDLQTGTAAMLLGAKPGTGLRAALETPDRVDELFIERAAQPAGDRLDVLAAEEKLSEHLNFAPGAVAPLLSSLRRRYNFVVADVPFGPLTVFRELLDLAHQRVLVMEPTLASVRDTLRLLALPNGPHQARRGVVVLNRMGLPGGLTRRQVEDALKMSPDVVIPYLPKPVGLAATLGQPAMAAKGGFRTGMLHLAREVAFVRLLDSDAGATQGGGAQRRGAWFGWGRR